jgi:hypothetical protein
MLDGQPATFEWIYRQFRDGLKRAEVLDNWLGCHSVTYHFIGVTGHRTVDHYDKWNRRPGYTMLGDGTVPIQSSCLDVDGSRPAKHLTRLVLDREQAEAKSHQELCSVRVVQDLCHERVFLHRPPRTPVQPPASPTSTRKAAGGSPFAPLWRRIPAGVVPKDRTVKLVVELRLDGCIRVPDGPFPATRRGASIATGGHVLAQAPDEQDVVRVVTWNTSPLDRKSSGNNSHAEAQFVDWLLKRRELVSAISTVQLNLVNFSPCGACADEVGPLLTVVRTQMRATPPPRLRHVPAMLSWVTLYPATASPTTWQNVVELGRAGWQVHAPRRAHPVDETVWREEGRRRISERPPTWLAV